MCVCVCVKQKERGWQLSYSTLSKTSTPRSRIQNQRCVVEGITYMACVPPDSLLRTASTAFIRMLPSDQALGRKSPKDPNIHCGGLHVSLPVSHPPCVLGKATVFQAKQLKKRGWGWEARKRRQREKEAPQKTRGPESQRRNKVRKGREGRKTAVVTSAKGTEKECVWCPQHRPAVRELIPQNGHWTRSWTGPPVSSTGAVGAKPCRCSVASL